MNDGSNARHASLISKFQIKQYLTDVAPMLERVESCILGQVDEFDPSVREYISYAIESSGKRLRPALSLLSARATGEVNEHHYDLATIVELIHLASLVHDDIMDHALIRRARPTANSKWGAELAVLLGDSLFAHALRLCTNLPSNDLGRAIADAASEVCAGEILQTQRRFDLTLTIGEYLKSIEMKTAALFRVSTELAAKLNHCPDATTQAFRTFGGELGIAYQIYDDCIDLFGTEEGTGKTLGTDLAKGKFTLPVLYLLEKAGPPLRGEIAETILRKDAEAADFVAAQVLECGGHQFTAERAQQHLLNAREALNVVPASNFRTQLQAIPTALHDHISSIR